ncbi:MAG: tetratricopeptide repeat protein, partial [Bacteroidota bacterium]
MSKHPTPWLFLLFGAFPFFLLAQTPPLEPSNYDRYHQKVIDFQFIQPDSAFHYSQLLIEWSDRAAAPAKQIEARLLRAELGLIHRRFELLWESLDQVETGIAQHRASLQDQIHVFESDQRRLMFMYQNTIDNQQMAIKMGAALLNDLEQYPNPSARDTQILEQSLYSLGVLYNKQGDYSNALDCYLKVTDLQKGLKMNDNYIAAIYYAQGNYDLALQSYQQSVQKLKEFQQRKQITKDHMFITAHHGLAKTYLALKETDAALRALQQSLTYHGPQDRFLVSTYNLFGAVNRQAKRYPQAEHYFNKALKALAQRVKAPKNHQYAYIYLNLGQTYEDQGQLDIALQHYQSAIYHLAPDFADLDYRSNPSIATIDFKMELLNALATKAKALVAFNQQQATPNPDNAMLSKETTLLAIDLIDSMRLDYTSEKDKQLLVEQSYSLYELAIQLALEADQVEEAFYLSEKSRAIVLGEALRKRQAALLAQVDQQTLLQIQQLRADRSSLQNQLAVATKTTRIKTLRQELFRLKTQYRERMKAITNNRLYQRALASQEPLALPKIRERLQTGQGLLEFFVGEQHIFAFLIHPQTHTLQYYRLPHSEQLQSAINTINEAIYREQTAAYVQSA